MKILSISDMVVPFIYSPQIRNLYDHIDFVIACGDLPYAYQEYIISMLDIPLFFVRGNHDLVQDIFPGGKRFKPQGGIDLHRKIVRVSEISLAGIEGSLRYKPNGSFQYTQAEMWKHVFRLIPGMMHNRLVTGKYLDIFVTHAPPWGTHDRIDKPHQGIKAFSWLNRVFHPSYHFHGHIHLYRPDAQTTTIVGSTLVVNTFGYRETTWERSN